MLGIFGLIFIIVAPFIIYKNAKQNGHNAIFWTLLGVAAGLGVQIVIPLVFGFVYAIVKVAQGSSEDEIQKAIEGPSLIIGIACLILSVVGVLLIMSRVNRIHEEKSFINPPPPPTDFN
jgi:hypothetical protein